MKYSIENIKRFSEWKQKWSNPDEMGLMNYISFNIHPDDILLLSKLFFPEFIEIDNGIFFKENFSESHYLAWKIKTNNDIIAMQKAINHIHIYDVFANLNENVEDTVFEEIGKILKFSWLSYLNKIFPVKSIIIDYENNEDNYGPTLTVYSTVSPASADIQCGE